MSGRRSILLYPLSLVYGAITGIRNFMYSAGILPHHEFSLPVICVGNITVGGTGKTPHCEYLISLLKEKYRVALLSRGYRRKSHGFLIATPGMTAMDIGDEPLQMAFKNHDITVAVDCNRVNGVNSILRERPDTEVIILDDGFQHRSLKPGFTVLLTDYNRLMVRDHLLPYGNLRENINNMYKADIILVTKCPVNISPMQRRLIVKEINKAAYQNLFFTSITYGDPVPVFPAPYNHRDGSATSPEPVEEVATGYRRPVAGRKESTGIVLVTGIADPQPLHEYIGKMAGEIIHLNYPDHHRFSEKDLIKITAAFDSLKSAEKFIFTTEKDAVRLREFTNIAEELKASFRYVPVGVGFLNDDKAEFDNQILDYVRKNRRNNRIP